MEGQNRKKQERSSHYDWRSGTNAEKEGESIRNEESYFPFNTLSRTSRTARQILLLGRRREDSGRSPGSLLGHSRRQLSSFISEGRREDDSAWTIPNTHKRRREEEDYSEVFSRSRKEEEEEEETNRRIKATNWQPRPILFSPYFVRLWESRKRQMTLGRSRKKRTEKKWRLAKKTERRFWGGLKGELIGDYGERKDGDYE